MQKHGEFDTNAQALEKRLQAHEMFGSGDLNAWIMDNLQPQPDDDVLDLGCGTGKQSLPLAELVGPGGSVTSVDLSPEALGVLRQRAQAAGVADRLRLIESDLDELSAALPAGTFNKVLASFSLYYTADRRKLLTFLHGMMKLGGTLFFCGPSGANNQELKVFHNKLKGLEGAGAPTPAAAFLEQEGPDIVRQLFAECASVTFENPIRFDSADVLFEYWSSYNLYEAELADAFRAQAEAHFKTNDQFTTVKRVLGVCGRR